MGIFKAFGSAMGNTVKDQWLEFFYCESISGDILMKKGSPRRGQNSSNQGNTDVISNGSIVAVADGQAAILVSGGKVTEVWDMPGEHTVTRGNPSAFGKNSGKELFGEVGRRFTFGGDVPPTSQRVYYFNTKEIMGNSFGGSGSIPFRLVDDVTGLDIDCSLAVSGTYSFRIIHPEITYKKLIGNVAKEYTTQTLVGQLHAEMNTVLRTALGGLSERGDRPSQINEAIPFILSAIREAVNLHLEETRGIALVSLAFSTFNITTADGRLLRDLQATKVLTDPAMAAGQLVCAQSEAMISAANNHPGQ